MARLILCERCHRHFFVSDTNCPFCMAPRVLAPERALHMPRGASRAQRLALVAAVAGQALVGCTNSRQPAPPRAGRGGNSAGSGGVGGFGANDAAGSGSSEVAGRPALAGSVAVQVYGAPLPADAGLAASRDSGAKDSGAMAQPPRDNPAPVYGASPPK